jgi:Stress responsive A/B Barrel Domain
MLTLRDDVSENDKLELLSAFAAMPRAMGFIRRYEFGFDLGNLGPGNPDFALVADFDNEEDWRRYSEYPDHLELTARVRMVTESMVRVQYLVAD